MAKMEFPEEWISRFVELQIKDLHGEQLTHQERAFLSAIEMAGQTLPGVVENGVLSHALDRIEAHDAAPYRIAASSDESSIYGQVREAIEKGEKHLLVDIEGRSLKILEIHDSENLVEPCYQEGFSFVIERASFDRQVVSRYGGIFIALDDLKKMDIDYSASTKTIRLYER